MTKNLSKCCGAETKLGGMPDFENSDEVCTVYNVCLKCKNPCDIDWNPDMKKIEKLSKKIKKLEEKEPVCHIDQINARIPGLMLSQRQIISQMLVEAYEKDKEKRSAKIYEQGKKDGTRETLAFISKEEGWEDSELHYMKKLGLSDNPMP